ncbi:MAG: hypothetical protein AAF322_19135 [Pseudomonadota bacterium]
MRVDMLGAEAVAAWRDYEEAEAAGVRGTAVEALLTFISVINDEPESARNAFASEWSARNLTPDPSYHQRSPNRQPLIDEVVAPYLFRRLAAEDARAATHLALLWRRIAFHSSWSELCSELRGPLRLLETALKWEPDHLPARQALTRVLAKEIEFAFHELPWLVVDPDKLRRASVRLRSLGPTAMPLSDFVETLDAVDEVLASADAERRVPHEVLERSEDALSRLGSLQ